ncbi:hypothetical protein [Mucilaginibacter defluvii]|uniref:hypothetical protein n=1 Tax=Mucilaginibacter defluvii TaxID=1196019 RepID=UPI0031EB7A9E
MWKKGDLEMRPVLAIAAGLLYLLVTAGDLGCAFTSGMRVVCETFGHQMPTKPGREHAKTACNDRMHDPSTGKKHRSAEHREVRTLTDQISRPITGIASFHWLFSRFKPLSEKYGALRYQDRIWPFLYFWHYLEMRVFRI